MADIARNYVYIKDQSDLEDVSSWLSENRYFCIDTETDSLNPFTAKLILLQLGNKDIQWIIDCRSVNVQPLKPWIEDRDITKVGQYLKHDWKILHKCLGWNLRNVVCTMITEQIIRCGIPTKVSLAALCDRYLRINIDKDEELRTSFGKTAVGELSERQLRYVSGDVIYPEIIARKQKELVRSRGLTATVALEREVLPVLASMEIAGMGIDTVAWNSLYQEAVIKRLETERILNNIFGVRTMLQGGLFGEDSFVRDIEYNSSKQLLKALSKLGYYLEGTDKEDIALAAIMGNLPINLAQAILTFRRSYTRVTRYGSEFLEAIQSSTGRIHTDFTQCNTTTGRLSSGEDEESDSDKVNLQNIPRASEYRRCFIPKPGYKLIVFDYQAIEPRILGELSMDPTYLFAFDNDKDLYGVVGTKILGEEVSKASGRPAELRDKTKITVLGNSYGTGKEKFHRKMMIDMNLVQGILNKKIIDIKREETDMMWDRFFEICPNIKRTLDDLSDLADPIKSSRKVYDELVAFEEADEVSAKILASFEKLIARKGNEVVKHLMKNRSYVTYSESIGGRKRYYKVYNRKFWTEGRNQPIQSTAADILKTAMVETHKMLEIGKYDAFLVNQVHDELIVECVESQATEVEKKMKHILLESQSKYLKRVPPKVEGGIKDRWEK